MVVTLKFRKVDLPRSPLLCTLDADVGRREGSGARPYRCRAGKKVAASCGSFYVRAVTVDIGPEDDRRQPRHDDFYLKTSARLCRTMKPMQIGSTKGAGRSRLLRGRAQSTTRSQ